VSPQTALLKAETAAAGEYFDVPSDGNVYWGNNYLFTL
jgi:hypothetical protein